MGRLDHVHIRVPDRAEAARWYAEHLGFEPVDTYDFWATGFEGGPLQISADGGKTMLALFEASEGHPMLAQKTGVAFNVDADTGLDVFLPAAQASWSSAVIFARTRRPSADVSRRLSTTIAEVDRRIALTDTEAIDDTLQRSLAMERLVRELDRLRKRASEPRQG